MYPFPRTLWQELTSYGFDLCDDYSGRSLCGARCIAVVGQLGDLVNFVAACYRTADELDLPADHIVSELADAVRSDNMGTGRIYYFTDIELEQ